MSGPVGFDPPKLMYFGALIRYLKAHGVSQVSIAKRLGVGQPSVSMWATNDRPVPERYQDALWEIVREAIQDLVDREGLEQVLHGWVEENMTLEGALYERLSMVHAALQPYIDMDAAKLKEALTPAVRGALLEAYHSGATLLKYLNRAEGE